MKRSVIIFLITIAILIPALIIKIIFFSSDSLEKAIDTFEDKDYIESIEMLNRLSKLSDYESLEKIYYYKSRSIYKLAKKLGKSFDDELNDVSLEKKGSEDYKDSKEDIEDELKEINKNIGSDLSLIVSQKKSTILPQGKFYNEFVSKYRGSSLIIDLDFEKLLAHSNSNPEYIIKNCIYFHQKYPNSNYLSEIVKLIFKSFQNSTISIKGNEKILWEIITAYGKKYPTGAEVNKIFISTGNNVNLRNSPGLDGKPVGKTVMNEVVIQLEKSMDTSQIGNTRDYWYKIITLKGLKGWIFGKFIKQQDIREFNTTEKDEKWTIEENFAKWEDSNTPTNWRHMDGVNKTSISFIANGEIKVIKVNSTKGEKSGLYNRYSTSPAFSILSKARYLSGDSTTIFSYTLKNSRSFILKIKDEEIDICGRKIPIHTSNWHEYKLVSPDGRFASLYIDGELISGRIPFVTDLTFNKRGIYSLAVPGDYSSSAEIEFIKVR